MRGGTSRPAKLAACCAFAWAVVASFFACGSPPPPLELCGEIPDGGCPIGRGGSCDDPTCAAIYDCVDGAWQATKQCPANGGASSTSSSGAGGDAGMDASPDGCTEVKFDHDCETTDCSPDLEFPDCPAAAVEGCIESSCLTGCGDLWICNNHGTSADPDPEWDSVGFCDDDGGLHLTQKGCGIMSP